MHSLGEKKGVNYRMGEETEAACGAGLELKHTHTSSSAETAE